MLDKNEEFAENLALTIKDLASMVDYWEEKDLPGKRFFRCDKMRATLTVNACAKNWRMADKSPDGTPMSCRLCAMGAMHAGELDASVSRLKGSQICSRCHRTSLRIIANNLCVSCYNRSAEKRRGYNAKGKPPVKLAALEQRRMRYMAGVEIKTVIVRETTGVDELIVAALRDNRQQVTFAWDSTAPIDVRKVMPSV